MRNDLDGSDGVVVKQERGVRTRNHLISVAAAEFDRNGYDGTSLSRLSRSAGISIGALTFHFAAKGELASAVEDSGRAATRRVVEGVTARGGPALETVSALVLALGRLIETDAAVRAAARLTQERAGAGPDWCGCWLPDVKELLEQAAEQGQLDPEVDPCPVTLLTAHLVGGVVNRVRRGRGERPGAVAGELRELWRLIRRGIAARPDPELPK
ncbi:TetR family transcriptional regulator [Streptomyces sp. NPDC001549]|uniref:TetR family transcriptional regulator n=1 Tax=Streptomyces sp. NPDC001549 TaxID=3364586 RepID=UPI0036A70D46